LTAKCIGCLIRNTFPLSSKRDWDAIKRAVRPIYTAVSAAAAAAALDELDAEWGRQYGAIIRLWRNAWTEFIPFLDYDLEIRTVLCSTNAIVIWSPRGGVLHVDHERLRGRDPRCGRGYLPLSITRISGGNHACSAGAVARLVA
jgi:putative transposase